MGPEHHYKPATPHFTKRARERGIATASIDGLFQWLRYQIANGGCDRCEKVMQTNAATFWRFHCADGIFYTVTEPSGCTPKTIYTQSMFSDKRAKHKRHRGSPSRRPKYRGKGKKVG